MTREAPNLDISDITLLTSAELDDFVYEVMARGNPTELEELSQIVQSFPHGVDESFVRRQWITNAIDCSALATIRWILDQKVDLSFRNNEGYTVLHSAIDREGENKHEVLNLLLERGAPINAKGINGWTPAHMAAVRDDVTALKLLHKYKADFSIRMEIDAPNTPLEEARYFQRKAAVAYLESVGQRKILGRAARRARS